jgi:hypothetical protein
MSLWRAQGVPGVQEFRSSGVQEFRSSGVQEFRSSGWEGADGCKQKTPASKNAEIPSVVAAGS